jgi:ATP:ADP antiporter, AAA family
MTETHSTIPEFSGWRACLWPVHYHELKKLIPMLLIFFFITLDYNILRTLKESVLITAKHSGAEVIPFAKVWGVFPGAVLTTLLYTWLSNRFSREKVCYIMLSLFMSYFFIFAFVLYPIRDVIHPHATADFLETVMPAGFKGLIALFRYWTFTIFYVASELWSSTILAVLIWGFANQITKINEAKRFYGIFGVGANFSGIFAGMISVYCCTSSLTAHVYIGEDSWHQSLILLISLVLICGLFAIAIFRWMNVYVLSDKRFYDPTTVKSEGEVKGKLSLKESLKILISSRYLACIALIVVIYNVVINLTEVIWKSQVMELYPHPADYTIYMNHIVSLIGVVATLCSLFVSNSAIRKYGWTFTAMLTPIVLSITSIAFFGFFFIDKTAPYLLIASLSITPLSIVVFIGATQNILSRAAKYSVFDATKEMAFVPLDPETKLLGKAAIDGFGSRFGKSGGSMILQTLLLFFTTLTASAPYVALALIIMLGIWSLAVKSLGSQFKKVSDSSEKKSSVTAPVSPSMKDVSVMQEG